MPGSQSDYRTNKVSEPKTPGRTFSMDERINDLLIRCNEQADKSRVWFSVDAFGITPENFGNTFYEMFGSMMEAAFEECIERIPPNRRYMKLRSRDTQNRVFIQLTYSNDTGFQRAPDQRMKAISEAVMRRNGYFEIRNSFDETSIRISVPDKRCAY